MGGGGGSTQGKLAILEIPSPRTTTGVVLRENSPRICTDKYLEKKEVNMKPTNRMQNFKLQIKKRLVTSSITAGLSVRLSTPGGAVSAHANRTYRSRRRRGIEEQPS